jgi:hypothetical protein
MASDQGLEDDLDAETANLYQGVVKLFDEGDFAGAILEDAVAKFESGDYAGAEAAAVEALGAGEATQDMLPDEQNKTPFGSYEGDGIKDRWRMALDRLTSTYGDVGESEMAESTFLRMLAWREGIQQQQISHPAIASSLFQRSMEYSGIDDATWFLRGLKPDDGHAIAEVIPLLGLGERVAAKAAVALWTLALRPKHRVPISERGGLELLTKALQQHLTNGELAAAGCGALRLLCQGHALAAQNRKTLTTRLDGPLTLISTMQNHRGDVEVQRESCGALGAIAMDYQPGAATIVSKDGILMCLEAMVSCSDQVVGDSACKALASICGKNAVASSGKQPEESMAGEAAEDMADVDWQVMVRQECGRGLAYCMRALEEQASQGDRIVLQSLLWASMIFLDDSNLRHRAIQMAPAVVKCMGKFPGHAQVQVPACGILWRLTVGHSARDEAVHQCTQIGAIGPICQAMRDLPCNLDLQQLAIGALRNIAFGNDQNKTVVVKAGGIEVVVTGMKRYPKDANLQEQAIGALTSLCDTVGRAAKCARLQGIEAIIAALRRHASVGHIAELGCIILCMFSDDQQLKHIIMRSGALQIAKALSRTENGDAQQWGCELLRDLSDGS